MIDSNSQQLAQYILNNKNPSMDLEDLIVLAENNRVLYTVARQNSQMVEIEITGKEWINKLVDTLKVIKNILKENEYIVTRTFKYIEYVTFDIDLFVDKVNYVHVIKKFKSNGFNIESHDASLGGRLPGMQVNIKKQGLLTIDLHQDFTWQKRQFLDPKLVMKNPVKKNIAGQIVLVPRPEIELLLCIADIAHERFNITLLDLIWLEGLTKGITDWDLIFDQAKKYKWLVVFEDISSIINQISLDIYGKTIISNTFSKEGKYRLPYFLNLPTCWSIYLNTFRHYQFPVISFLYMHYNQLRFFLTNKMPYYSPWHKI